MTSHALLSSESQDWQTPQWFLDLVRAVSATGEIALDPATSITNPTRARRFFAQDLPVEAERPFGCWGRDGLGSTWGDEPHRGLTFVNPPYGAHLSGAVDPDYEIKRKGITVGIGRGWGQRIAQHRGETIALLPARTDAAWWKVAFEWADLALFWSSPEHGARISFVSPQTGKEQQGSNLASMVLYRASEDWLRRHVGRDRFAQVFGPHGTLVTGGARRGGASVQLDLAAVQS